LTYQKEGESFQTGEAIKVKQVDILISDKLCANLLVYFTKNVYFYDTIKRKAIDSNSNPGMSAFFFKYL